MKMKTKQRSLNQHFQSNSRITYSFFIIITLLFAINSLYLISNLRTINQTNSQLINYYKSIELAYSSGKNYINTFTGDKEYQEDINSSFESIEDIILTHPNLWQFEQLNNMTKYFNQQIELTKSASNDAFQSEYDNLILSYHTIQNSSKDYFSILAAETQNLSTSFYSTSVLIMIFSFVILICFTLLSLIYNRIKVNEVLEPVKSITGNFRRIQNNSFELEHTHSNIEEIQYLNDSLLEMSNALQQNIVYEKNMHELENKYLSEYNKNLKYEEMIAQSQLKMIQKRVDPHFLFNTLNSIYKMSLKENANQTANLLEKTSTYFRYNLDYYENTSNIIHEISITMDYIYIQNLRFRNDISFRVEIDEDIPPITIPGMIIQPLIENSIETAFDPIQDDKEINIAVQYRHPILAISVSDNGIGMPEEAVDHIFMNDMQYFNKKDTLTLYNIYYRLKDYFGKRVKFNINTSQDCGFETIIEIMVGDENETHINS